MDAFASEERLMPHLHLSLQAGDDLILKRMKRRHSRADAIALTRELRRRRPGMVFGGGFHCGISDRDRGHVPPFRRPDRGVRTHLSACFPLLPRPGTPAA